MKSWIIRVTINLCKDLNKTAWYRKTEALNDEIAFTTEDKGILDDKYLATLPKLGASIEFDGMGFGAHMAYNVNELKDSNPWSSEDSLKSMPVFKNKL